MSESLRNLQEVIKLSLLARPKKCGRGCSSTFEVPAWKAMPPAGEVAKPSRSAAHPEQDWQARGAGGLVETCPALRNKLGREGAVLQLVSLVMKSLFLLFTKQQIGVLQPTSSLPDYYFIVFFLSTKLPQQLQCS